MFKDTVQGSRNRFLSICLLLSRNGMPLQYSCLENRMNRGAWQVIVHRVAKSQTRLNTYTHTILHTRTRFYSYTPVFLPGESQRQRGLLGHSPWGCKELDTTKVTQRAHTHAHTQTHTHTDTQTHTQTHRHTDTHTILYLQAVGGIRVFFGPRWRLVSVG